jgi:hypothetical protein
MVQAKDTEYSRIVMLLRWFTIYKAKKRKKQDHEVFRRSLARIWRLSLRPVVAA